MLEDLLDFFPVDLNALDQTPEIYRILFFPADLNGLEQSGALRPEMSGSQAARSPLVGLVEAHPSGRIHVGRAIWVQSPSRPSQLTDYLSGANHGEPGG